MVGLVGRRGKRKPSSAQIKKKKLGCGYSQLAAAAACVPFALAKAVAERYRRRSRAPLPRATEVSAVERRHASLVECRFSPSSPFASCLDPPPCAPVVARPPVLPARLDRGSPARCAAAVTECRVPDGPRRTAWPTTRDRDVAEATCG